MTNPIVVGSAGNKIIYDSATMIPMTLYANDNSWTGYLQLSSSSTGSGYTVPVGKKLIVYNISYTTMSASGYQQLGYNTSTAGIGNAMHQSRGTSTPIADNFQCLVEVPAGNMLIGSIYYGSYTVSAIEVDA
jgi:hypothetical protein